MNSNRKIKTERVRTPVHFNASEYVFKNSATKRFSPNLSRRQNLNETVGLRPGSSSDPKFKIKLSTQYEINHETECDMVYNDYLQAGMKKQFVENRVREHGQILKDQLLIQTENLHKRQQNLTEISADSKNFQTKSEVVLMMDYLQEHFACLTNECEENNIKIELDHFKDALNLKCDKIILKNIKALENREEYEFFFSILELTLAATQKIINSGRNFEEVHNLAENMRNLSCLVDVVKKSQRTVSELEKNTLYTYLQNMSDFFAKKYKEYSC